MGFKEFYEHRAYESMRFLLRSSSISMTVGTSWHSALLGDLESQLEIQSQALQTGTYKLLNVIGLLQVNSWVNVRELSSSLFHIIPRLSLSLIFPCDFGCHFYFKRKDRKRREGESGRESGERQLSLWYMHEMAMD